MRKVEETVGHQEGEDKATRLRRAIEVMRRVADRLQRRQAIEEEVRRRREALAKEEEEAKEEEKRRQRENLRDKIKEKSRKRR